jgi:hypothetical protein
MIDKEKQEATTKKNGSFLATSNLTIHSPEQTQLKLLDSGATHTYIQSSDIRLLTDVAPCTDGPTVSLPDGTLLKATHRGKLVLPFATSQSFTAFVLPGIERTLVSVASLCDEAGLHVTFCSKMVQVFGPPSAPGMNDGPLLITGPRCPDTALWNIPITVAGKPDSYCCAMLSKYRTQSQLVEWVHAIFFSPSNDVFLEAIKRGYIKYPGLTYESACKFPPASIATDLGHLRGKAFKSLDKRHPNATFDDWFPKQMFTRTKPVSEREPAEVSSMVLLIPRKQINHMDLSGRLPVTSHKGYEYILLSFCLYANYIHLELMKNRSASEYVRAYARTHEFFLDHGIRSDHLRLDNEASNDLRAYCAAQSPPIKMEFVPPNQHRANMSERQMGIMKNHLIAGINTTDPEFELEAWDELMPQCEQTLNMMRQSGVSLFMSAWTQLHGEVDYVATPLAPPGMSVIVYDTPDTRGSFANRGTRAFYVGPAPQHHGCFTVYVPSTKKTRISDTVSFHPKKGWTLPGASPNDVTNGLLEALEKQIRTHGPSCLAGDAKPIPPPDSFMAALMDYARKVYGEAAASGQRVLAAPVGQTPDQPPGIPIVPAPAVQDSGDTAASEALAQQLEDEERDKVRAEKASQELAQKLQDVEKDNGDAAFDASETLARKLLDEDRAKNHPPVVGWEVAGKRRKRTPRLPAPKRKERKSTEEVSTPPASKEQAPAAPPEVLAPAGTQSAPASSMTHGIGTRFKKTFGDGVTYVGQVMEIGPKVRGGTKRRVVYTDGDSEHLFTWEIDGLIKLHGAVEGVATAVVPLTLAQLETLSVTVPVTDMSLEDLTCIVNAVIRRDDNDIKAGVKPAKASQPSRRSPKHCHFRRHFMYSVTSSEKSPTATMPKDGVAPITFRSVLQGPDKDLWIAAASTELDKLLRGGADSVMRAIPASQVPKNRHVAYYSPQVKIKMTAEGTVQRRVRGTYGGNVSDYEGDVSALVADITTVKLLLNEVVSDGGYSLLTADIIDYYLGSPLERKEYMFLRLNQLPDAGFRPTCVILI